MSAVLRRLLTANLNKRAKKANLVHFLTKKSLNFEKFSIDSSQKKTRIEQFNLPPLSLEINWITLQLTILTYYSKIVENLVENTENMNENSWITSNIHKNSNPDNSL